MSEQKTTPAETRPTNRHERRRLAKIGLARALADDARPEWVRVNGPGAPVSQVHVREEVG